jgi:hypothetical protein
MGFGVKQSTLNTIVTNQTTIQTDITTIKADVDTIKTGTVKVVELWSVYDTQVPLTTAAATKALPSITISGIPDGYTVTRALAAMKVRDIENENVGLANGLDGDQNIQCQKQTGGTLTTAIALKDGQFAVPANDHGQGDVPFEDSDQDISSQVPANDGVLEFQWTSALAAQDNLNFNDLQVGVRLYCTPS